MKYNTAIRSTAVVGDAIPSDEDDCEGVEEADAHVDLIEFPANAGAFELLIWIFLFPLRWIMHWTLPDVRHMDSHGDSETTISMAFFSTFMCLVWLVIGSYAMVASLEDLAELLDIPDAVIGFTVSAAGKCQLRFADFIFIAETLIKIQPGQWPVRVEPQPPFDLADRRRVLPHRRERPRCAKVVLWQIGSGPNGTAIMRIGLAELALAKMEISQTLLVQAPLPGRPVRLFHFDRFGCGSGKA